MSSSTLLQNYTEAGVSLPPTQREIDGMPTEELLALYKATGNQDLKWPLVLRYEKLLRRIALQICGVYNSFTQVEDIIQEGVITLLSAVDKFDPDKGIKFETFVTKRIRGMIIDLARQQDWLPRRLRKRAKEIDLAVNELYGHLGRFPTDMEVSQKLEISPAKYREDLMNLNLSNIISLEALFDGRDPGYADSILPSSGSSSQPDLSLQEREFQEVLVAAIHSLRENEQLVLSLYYQQELNMREIAQVMEISEPRVSQIHSKAIQKLRMYLEQYLRS
jgi:RNA polymerase sigma factor for flagellar operon FliA